MQDLNKMVEEHPALYSMDYDPEGFKWLVVDDHNQVYSHMLDLIRRQLFSCSS